MWAEGWRRHFYLFIKRKIIGFNGKVLFAVLTLFGLAFHFVFCLYGFLPRGKKPYLSHNKLFL